MVIGLTGGIGSGKTTVAEFFQRFETVAVYIADLEAKKIMNSSDVIQTKLIEEFGKNTYHENELNNRYLASIVFNNKEKLHVLNSILHPEVRRNFQEFMQQNANKAYILYESAILFESNSQHQFDFVVSVFTDLEERIKRVLKRDNSVRQQVLNRINNQWKEDKKLLLSNYIINNYSLQETEDAVKDIHRTLTKKGRDML